MDENISRRSFLTKLIGVVFGATGILFAAPVVKYLIPKSSEGGENIFTNADGKPILENEIKEGASFTGLSRSGPTIIIRRGGKLRALSAVCTHLGCLVKWVPNEDVFFCPCHAGKFDVNGANISGPPPVPLAAYNVETANDGRILLS
ncbi:MAG: Rieske 2Fe-2S domain-containing protein [Deltaproteobacteria bacterium]|nr:Rieske 2Fe-2S domain-containing protein [Deltaproteobacteria bacterium]